MNTKTAKEQRITASHPAVILTRCSPQTQDFCGETQIRRCKFLGRTAKTAAKAVTLLGAEAMLRAEEAARERLSPLS